MTPSRPHDWRMMQVTPMVQRGEGLYPTGASTVTVGCFSCNLGWDEGKDINCPGQDLFEEESDASPDANPDSGSYGGHFTSDS